MPDTDYAQAADVKRVLQFDGNFNETTRPTLKEVQASIKRAETEIENMTQHAWRAKTITDQYYDIPEISWDGIFVRIKLRHREIRTLASGSGDKLEIWNGSTWEDWLTAKTEGRANDYWVDEGAGVVFLRISYRWHRKKAVRMTYRYGASSVPEDVRDATALVAAIKIIQSDDQTHAAADTGDPTKLNYDARVSQWQRDVDRIISNRSEFSII